MDSNNTFAHKSKFKRIIRDAEDINDDILSMQSKNDRTELILWFFKTFKAWENKKYKELTILLFDRVWIFLAEKFSFEQNKVFLFSLFSIHHKLNSERSEQLELIESIDKLQCKFKITKAEIYMAEIYLLNLLDWRFNVFGLSEIIEYFINYFCQIKNISIKECVMCSISGFCEFFTECGLMAFNTRHISYHTLSLAIILIAFDQINSSFKEEDLINFISSIHNIYKVDLLRIENYKILLLNYMEQVLKLAIVRKLPDTAIQSVYKNLETEFPICQKQFSGSKEASPMVQDTGNDIRSMNLNLMNLNKSFKEESESDFNLIPKPRLPKTKSLHSIKSKFKEDEQNQNEV
jgi:hypothetical protein